MDKMLYKLNLILIVCCFWRIGEVYSRTLSQTVVGSLQKRGGYKFSEFPNEFPTPISCEWIIEASTQKKIILYFTQFYLNSSFTIWDMKYYDSSEKSTIDKRKRGEIIIYENRMDFLVSRRRFVLIRFTAEEIATNMHVRVERYLMNVYGFNITYEIVPSSTAVKENTCSIHKCSFLGKCLANADFSDYKCECFGEFYGDSCQFGEHCSPRHNRTTCYNGGTCRYHEGSKTNHCDCPPGFIGFMCEIRDFECQYLECSHMCKRDNQGTWRCVCYSGFELASDNRTCVGVQRDRTVGCSIINNNRNTTTSSILGWKNEIIHRMVFKVMVSLSLRSVSCKHTTAGCLSFNRRLISLNQEFRGRVFQFFFYCQSIDLQFAERALKMITGWGVVGGYDIDKTFLYYRMDPSLNLMAISVDSYKDYAIQGGLMRIVCTARGSDSMEVRWFKDGYPIDITLTKRNPWVRQIAHTFDKTYLFYLNIDSVSMLDAGVFKCVVSDYEDSQNKSILVNVLAPPRVEIQPMTVTAEFNASISVKCMSPDDVNRKFRYKWFIDGRQVSGVRHNESTHNIFPVGLILNIRTMTKTIELTCQVQNAAGLANLTALAYMLPRNRTVYKCEEELKQGTQWHETPNNQLDVNRCPNGGGYTRRLCRCLEHGVCAWKQPDFSECQSVDVTQLYDELDLLCLGYQHPTLIGVFRSLSHLVLNPSRKFFSGDINLISGILKNLFDHASSYPVLLEKPIPLHRLATIMDKLLQESANTTHSEKKKMVVCTNLLRLIDIIAGSESLLIEITDRIDVELAYMEIHRKEIMPKGVRYTSNFHTVVNESSYKSATSPRVLGGGYVSQRVLVFRFRSLLDLLETKTMENSKMPLHTDISDIYSVLQHPSSKVSKDMIGVIEIHHTKQVRLSSESDNRTQCVGWKFSQRQPTSGSWETDSCVLLYNTINSTWCHCVLPGHFRVILLPPKQEKNGDQENEDGNRAYILQMSFMLSLPSLIITAISYIIIWRRLSGDVYAIHFNFTICLIAVDVVFISCRGHSQSPVACLAGQILLHLLYLAAHSFLFVEALHMLVSIGDKFNREENWRKYVTVGWGIPMLITSTVFGASEIFGYRAHCGKTCWLNRDEWEFYGFLIPLIVIIIAHAVIMLLCVLLMRTWNTERMYMRRKQCLINIGKSIQLCVLVAISSLLPMTLEADNQILRVYFLLLTNIILGIMTLMCRVLLDKEVLLHLRQFWKTGFMTTQPETPKAIPRGVLGGFMTDIDDDPSVKSEVESISEYYYAVNRRKFTRERCEQLSALLGSSLEDSSASTFEDEPKDNNVSNTVGENGTHTSADVHVHEHSDDSIPGSSTNDNPQKHARMEAAVYKCRKFAVKQSVLNSIYEVPDTTVPPTNVEC
ncbi:hypothetical protein ScPMuIL_006170 [Solemya velum]